MVHKNEGTGIKRLSADHFNHGTKKRQKYFYVISKKHMRHFLLVSIHFKKEWCDVVEQK